MVEVSRPRGPGYKTRELCAKPFPSSLHSHTLTLHPSQHSNSITHLAMSSSSTAIAIIGATGHQGGGVVDVLLSTTDYKVRAISSNPSSDKAKSLLDKYSEHVKAGRFEIVEGNLNDRSSLDKGLDGAYGLFASFSPSVADGPIEENPEVAQGKNLVDAAKVSFSHSPFTLVSSLTLSRSLIQAVGITHFVYSSLPSLAKLTHGMRTEVFPFESKALVEQYARKNFENSTFLIPGPSSSFHFRPDNSDTDRLSAIRRILLQPRQSSLV